MATYCAAAEGSQVSNMVRERKQGMCQVKEAHHQKTAFAYYDCGSMHILHLYAFVCILAAWGNMVREGSRACVKFKRRTIRKTAFAYYDCGPTSTHSSAF